MILYNIFEISILGTWALTCISGLKRASKFQLRMLSHEYLGNKQSLRIVSWLCDFVT